MAQGDSRRRFKTQTVQPSHRFASSESRFTVALPLLDCSPNNRVSLFKLCLSFLFRRVTLFPNLFSLSVSVPQTLTKFIMFPRLSDTGGSPLAFCLQFSL